MNVADHDSSPDLGHMQLGHISQIDLGVLVKEKYLLNLNKIQPDLCMHRLFDRQAAQSLLFKEGRTIKEDSCVEVGSHRHVQSYGDINIQ